MFKGNVLVVDDEQNILKMIELALNSFGFQTEVFSDPEAALKRAQEKYFDIAFIDLKMQPIDGLQVLAHLKRTSEDTTIVLMTAHGTIESAVEAIKKGAYDYLTKPFTYQEFTHIAERVYSHHHLMREVKGLLAQMQEEDFPNTIATKNFRMRDIIKTAKDIANSDIPVLIEGESGTGKELLARYIHENSDRAENPFMAINCAAIPENLFESELFGHTKGSFTGAIKDRIGRIEMADQGTVFLDEVAEIPKPMQVKLLRFLQSMEYERVGESITRKVNVRIISATNRSIDEELGKGELRDDFYYRLSGVRFKLPPLSQRKEDLPILAEYFFSKYSPENKYELLPETMKYLMDYDWPGNVREFENVIKRLIVFSKDGKVKPEYLPIEVINEKPKQFSNVIPKLEELEKQHIIEVLRLAPNPKEAAKILGISETTLWRKRKLYDL